MPIPHHLCPTFPAIPSEVPSAAQYTGKIVVIGAGIAGISAAVSLRRMGFTNVAVLEASDRIGGRLKATNTFDGCSLDTGAEWIHSSRGADVLRSIAQFDATSQGHDTTELIPYQPTWHFKSQRSRLLTWLYAETKFKSTTWYDWFATNLLEHVKDWVVLNSPVTKIEYNNHHEHEVTLTLRDGSTQTADCVICTAPLAVLKEELIEFNPQLPSPMKEAINTVSMPPGFRILFQMKHRFYNDLTSTNSLLDLIKDQDDLTFIYDPLLGKGLQDLNVIAYVAIGPKNAGAMSQLSDKDLAKAALDRIDEIYNGNASVNLLGAPVVQNWTSEPFIRGAYTFPCSTKVRQELGKPLVGKSGRNAVFFAGEHTSTNHASLVPGAACEGRRAALEVLASV